MSEQPHPDREIEPEYPAGIVTEQFVLDDLTFTPDSQYPMERATRDDEYVGDILFDTPKDQWFARKHDARGELTDWKPMRCAAEARAFLVSRRS